MMVSEGVKYTIIYTHLKSKNTKLSNWYHKGSHSHFLSLCLTVSLTFSRSVSLSVSLSVSHFLSLGITRSLSLSVSLSLSLTLSYTKYKILSVISSYPRLGVTGFGSDSLHQTPRLSNESVCNPGIYMFLKY